MSVFGINGLLIVLQRLLQGLEAAAVLNVSECHRMSPNATADSCDCQHTNFRCEPDIGSFGSPALTFQMPVSIAHDSHLARIDGRVVDQRLEFTSSAGALEHVLYLHTVNKGTSERRQL